MKHRKLDVIDYWIIGAGFKIEKGLELSPRSSKSFKTFQKNIALAYIYQLTKFGDLMSRVSKDILKNAPCLMC